MKRTRWLLLAIGLLATLAAGAYGFWKLSSRAEAVAGRLAAAHKRLPDGWTFTYSTPVATGQTGVHIDSLRLSNQNGITLTVRHVEFAPSLWSAFVGPLRLADLEIDSLALVVSQQFKPKPTRASEDTTRSLSPFQQARALQAQARSLLGRLPKGFSLRSGLVVFAAGKQTDTLRVAGLGPAKTGMRGTLALPNDTVSLAIRLSPGKRSARFGWSGGTKAVWALPALFEAYGTGIGGNRGALEVALEANGAFTIQLTGRALSVQHPRLASGPVQFDKLNATVVGKWLPDGMVLDSTQTTYQLNSYRGYAGGRLVATATDTLLQFSLGSDTLRANGVLDSLPRGLLPHIEGMRAKGRVRQHLYVNVSTSAPDSAVFAPTFWCDSCTVTRWGAVNPRILNDTFTHRTYREQRLLRIAPGSVHYTPLPEITPYVWNAVMISEDGGFFGHQGFYPEMLGKALAANLAAGRIVRGGSTITMQLVKNVFLTPEKHLGRKIEEALLVWLIESQRLVPKRRLLEVYLNVIEWGPGVYGVNEAAQYYFNRHPSQLYYTEGIFLAMIVPAPRRFRWHFDTTGHLRPHVDKYYQVLMDHLQRREVISEAERAVWDPANFRLTGLAARELGQTPTPTWPDARPSDDDLIEDLDFFDEDLAAPLDTPADTSGRGP